MRILFDKNVPVGTRTFLSGHEVHTVVEMGWPDQLENGELLEVAEHSGFHLMVTSDQNIRHQQNLAGRKTRPDCACLEHLAGGAKARRGDNRDGQCCHAGKLRVYRNATPVETAKGGAIGMARERVVRIVAGASCYLESV